MNHSAAFRIRDVFQLAVWFGLVTGFVEAAFLLFMQGVHWETQRKAVAWEIVWISPVMNVCLLTASVLPVALLAVGLRRWVKEPAVIPVFCFSLFTFFDWVFIAGKLRLSAAGILAIGLAAVATRMFLHDPSIHSRRLRRTLPVLAAICVLIFLGISGGSWLRYRLAIHNLKPLPLNTPNVLIVVLDTIRADHLGVHGYSRATSPNIDRIASRSMRFNRAISTSSWTLPAHASLLTGRYPYEHGANQNKFDGRFVTLPEVLQKHGYRSAAISANVAFFGRREGFGRFFMWFEDYFHSVADMALRTFYGQRFQRLVLVRLGYEDYPARKLAPEVTSRALRWLDHDRDKPFFLVLNYFDAHDPYVPPQPWRSMFSKLKLPGGLINGQVFRVHPKMTPEQLQGEIDAYDGAIAYVDNSVGKLWQALEERGLTQNTIVVITSDHGESFGEHGVYFHRNGLYREVIHVPLIVHWPQAIPNGLQVDTPVSIASIPATLLEMLGMPSNGSFHAPSLLTLRQKPNGDVHWPEPLAEMEKFYYSEVEGRIVYIGPMKSLVGSKYQFIMNNHSGTELYDWYADPSQHQNLAGNSQYSSLVEEFRKRINSMGK